MSKALLFSLIWMLTGNPILAIIVILVIYYVIDQRYFGLLPSVVKPFRRWSRMSNLRRVLSFNPHDMSARYELARIYMERRQFKQALALLQQLSESMQSEPAVLADTGVCQLGLGRLDIGEQLIMDATASNPNVHYGEPYLKLAEALAPVQPSKALSYLSKFQERNASSCEAYYQFGRLQKRLGNQKQAKAAWRQCLRNYRTLPKFRKRRDRRWALLALIRQMTG
ncbi:tetratricopeptide repeat protein [Alicyclobacillus acidoterrestris]|uniref:Tetratricopeptide repeat protein n=1 Tax=Alicyclobacillus acidoterrestris (strain ATCC 49025 / DSM 3922 / CIP 106132 / NCIMB 13137 / GD3B) TaxID=1356854 RepID=T0CZG1_ALIAG|nr:tetratricopeptide repeat protein [Alicyclobacillus acidoterrestris]EPZ42946.1 hypothetical protein N007_14170 [Alicyclobacillus acidoterrestris ATCC 49025]UNO50037.1 tetratricopeptide repeat protein [Alicyclobacillus acidoterrestris]GEO25251.1 hypothetical protein AAC03nite_10360 [Alicyclobacillus acidoterrestris]